MKKIFLLLLISLIKPLSAHACQCSHQTFTQEISQSDHIFIGTVFKKAITNKAYYSFTISKTFKGTQADTVTIETGFGGPDCGMDFVIGKTYIVYSHAKKTSRCRRTTLLENSTDTGKIKYVFEDGFSNTVGKTTHPLLTDNEAEYFNYELLTQRKNFDFRQKTVAFVITNSLIDKQQYFRNWGGHDVVNNLVILTEEEKQKAKGYDAILVSWRKQGISKGFRKQLIKKLT